MGTRYATESLRLSATRLREHYAYAGQILYPQESAIVMIWHIDVGFPTRGSPAPSGTLRSGPRSRYADTVEPLLMADRPS